MVPESFLLSLVYDVGTGVTSRLRDDHALKKAVESAAESTANEADSITKSDLVDIFEAELDGEPLSTTEVSDARSDLVYALKVRTGPIKDVSHETLLDSFLQNVESNLIKTGQPEVVSRILYKYVKETNMLAETVKNDIQQHHERYHQDLEALSQWSDRLAPEPSSYRLPGTDTHVDLNGIDAIDSTVKAGENVLVTGPAGVGKSGVLAERYHDRTEQSPVYFLDAREFGQFDSVTAVERELGVQTSLREVFGELASQYDQCTVLVDQLDNVRTEPVGTVFRNLLLDLAEVDGLTVICACRSWDLEQPLYERLAEADTFQKVKLEPLAESRVQSLLTDIGIDTAGQTQDIVELCQSLLNLSLLADIRASKDSFDTDELSSQIELWDAYRKSLDREGSHACGTTPQTWDASPVERAVAHARSSLRDGTTTFTVDRRNPGDQRLISRGAIIEDWKRRYQFRHDKLQSYFYAWDANVRAWSIEQILSDGIDERIAADIFDWLLQFYSEDPAKCTSFIRDGLGSDSPLGFYARYALAASARDIGTHRLPEETVVAVIDALQSDQALAREFYRDLTSPDWARQLVNENRIADSGQFAANYVAGLADEHPNILIEALSVDEVPSRSHLRAYLSVVEDLDEHHLVAFTNHLIEYLPSVESETVQLLERDLRDIVEELLTKDHAEPAQKLIAVLAEPTGREVEERELESYTTVDVTIGSRVRPQTLQSLFDERGEALIETCGPPLVSVLDEHLRTCLNHLTTGYSGDIAPEQAIRRQTALMLQNPTRIQVVLLRAIESSLEHLLTTDPADAREYLQDYRSEGGVFRRTALAVLAAAPHRAKSQVREILTEPANVNDHGISTEFITLLGAGFDVLSPDEQTALLDHIIAGPDEDEIRESVRRHPDIDSDDEIDRVVRVRVERWQLRRLYQVRDEIEEPYRSTVEQLIDRHGDIEYSPGSGYHVPVSSGDEEDETSLDVASLDADAFVTACVEHAKQYQSDNEQDDLATGPRDRLARAVYHRFRDAPDVHLPFFSRLVETKDEVFVERIVEALQLLITNGEYEETIIDDWQSIIEGLITFCKPNSLETAWPRNCRQSVAEFLYITIGHQRSTLPVIKYQNDLATVLAALLDDQDPTGPTDTWDSPLGNDHTVHINGVRAMSINATSHFLRIIHREPENYDHQVLWERLTELLSDPSRPVRFAFGKQLRELYTINESFVTSHLDTLLPEGKDHETLSKFTSVWEGYLTTRRLHPELFEILRPKYRNAIDIHKLSVEKPTDDEDTSDDAKPGTESDSPLAGFYADQGSMPTQVTYDARAFEPLCKHLACAYAETSLDLDDDLIQAVFTVNASDLSVEDPPSADRVFANTFFDLLANAQTPESEKQFWERTTRFWTERLEETDDSVPIALGQYADVLANATPIASLDDVVELLVETAPAMTESLRFRRVLEFLATEVEDDGEQAVSDAMAVLDALVDHANQPYRFTASDERWTIVSKAAAAGDERALRIAEQFFQQGESEYERIIERHKTNSDPV